jgi:hypothetical protein
MCGPHHSFVPCRRHHGRLANVIQLRPHPTVAADFSRCTVQASRLPQRKSSVAKATDHRWRNQLLVKRETTRFPRFSGIPDVRFLAFLFLFATACFRAKFILRHDEHTINVQRFASFNTSSLHLSHNFPLSPSPFAYYDDH